MYAEIRVLHHLSVSITNQSGNGNKLVVMLSYTVPGNHLQINKNHLSLSYTITGLLIIYFLKVSLRAH